MAKDKITYTIVVERDSDTLNVADPATEFLLKTQLKHLWYQIIKFNKPAYKFISGAAEVEEHSKRQIKLESL